MPWINNKNGMMQNFIYPYDDVLIEFQTMNNWFITDSKKLIIMADVYINQNF